MLDKESWLYRSGDFWLPQRKIKFLHTYLVGSDTSLVYVNYWHGMHFLSGLLFGLVHFYIYHFEYPVYTYILLHTLWEIWQLSIGMTEKNLRGLLDSGVDTCFGLVGMFTVVFLQCKSSNYGK